MLVKYNYPQAKKLPEDDAKDDSINGLSDADTEEEVDGGNLSKSKVSRNIIEHMITYTQYHLYICIFRV